MAITLFSGLALKGVLEDEILPPFIERTGIPIARIYEPTKILFDLVRKGQQPDVVIGVTSGVNEMANEGYVQPGTIRGLVRSDVGVAVAPDTPTMPISTEAEFVDLVRSAASIAYSSTGASGGVFQRVAVDLGLTEFIAAKAVVLEKGFTAEAVRDGRAEVAIQQISELAAIPDTKIIGSLPASLHAYVELSIALGAYAHAPVQARELTNYLTNDARRHAFENNHLKQVV